MRFWRVILVLVIGVALFFILRGLLPVLFSYVKEESEFLQGLEAFKDLISFVISLIGSSIAVYVQRGKPQTVSRGKIFRILKPEDLELASSGGAISWIDRGIIEMFGPMGLSQAISCKAFYVKKLQTNYLYHATFLVLVGSTL